MEYILQAAEPKEGARIDLSGAGNAVDYVREVWVFERILPNKFM
jgi:hypothetical protein